MKPPVTIGLDIGGTRLKGGVIDQRGRILARDIEPTYAGQPLREFEVQLDTLVLRLTKKTGGKISAIGAAITGPVNPDVGCVYLPGKIRSLDRHKTVPYLKRRWQVPVTADNDGRMACYGEWKAGAGRGQSNLLVLTMGTGIGSGVVMDNRLLTDRHLQRGTQCGHLIINDTGPYCLTGTRGTGESLASVTALVQEVRSHIARGLPATIACAEAVNFQTIVVAVRRRDAVVSSIWERWLDQFATVILNSYYAYTPDLILLAGGPSKAAGLFLKPLEKRLNRLAFRVPVGFPIHIRKARLGEDAGWLGAALRIQELARKQTESVANAHE